jgi:hypothetical protein
MGTENCTTAEHFQSRYQRGGWKLNAEKHVVPVPMERLYFADTSVPRGGRGMSCNTGYLFYVESDTKAKQICSLIGIPEISRISRLYRFSDNRQLVLVPGALPVPIAEKISYDVKQIIGLLDVSALNLPDILALPVTRELKEKPSKIE